MSCPEAAFVTLRRTLAVAESRCPGGYAVLEERRSGRHGGRHGFFGFAAAIRCFFLVLLLDFLDILGELPEASHVIFRAWWVFREFLGKARIHNVAHFGFRRLGQFTGFDRSLHLFNTNLADLLPAALEVFSSAAVLFSGGDMHAGVCVLLDRDLSTFAVPHGGADEVIFLAWVLGRVLELVVLRVTLTALVSGGSRGNAVPATEVLVHRSRTCFALTD